MDEEPRERSAAAVVLLLNHVRAVAGEAGVARVRAAAGRLADHPRLDDPTRWLARDTTLAMFAAAVEVLGDPGAMVAVGASMPEHGADDALAMVRRSRPSVRAMYLGLPLGHGRFDATSTIEVVEATGRRVTLRRRTVPGYAPSRLECDLQQGLLQCFPRLHGRRAATVRHTACQVDGAPACEFRVTWQARRGGRGEPALPTATDDAATVLRLQLEELQRAATDLLSSDDLETLLGRVVDRVTTAVGAPGALVVVAGPTGPRVHARGLAAERAADVVARLADGTAGPELSVVPVASPRRHHGHLVAAYPPGHTVPEGSAGLLAAYAGHAAAALDLITALEDSRREAARATTLLRLGDDLAEARDAAAVGGLVSEALIGIVGCDSASVMLWDPSRGTLRAVGAGGMTDAQRELFFATPLRADSTAELMELLTRHEVVIAHRRSASPDLAALLGALDVATVVAVPLLAGEVLMGVATASWAEPGLPVGVDAEVMRRVAGVSTQAATALQNVRLRATVDHQASHDPLTGLPNRTQFARTLDDTLRDAGKATTTAVLFADLDRFAAVNVSRGHRAGDELLRQAAARLRGALRPHDTVARLSGDEFAVLLGDVGTEDRALAVARRLVEVLDEPFRIDGRELRITSSVGLALHAGPDGRGERLLAAATTAMHEAKARGRNEVVVSGHVEHTAGAPSLEAELGRAVEAGQMRLFFQPVLDLSTPERVVVGAEALIRWAHPRLGLLAPGSFLPVAEESGLVTELDLWALGAACETVAGWPEVEGGPPLTIAVNLAGATLVDPRLVPAVRAALHAHGIAPERLALEVVESRSLTDLPGVVERMVELRQMGVRISLDDFGTGYSTMAWLHALPVDQIKIDRSFIMTLPDDGAALALVRGMLALARELGLEVIAEGVEEPGQLALLREVGCSRAQGYLLGRPAPQLDTSASLPGSR